MIPNLQRFLDTAICAAKLGGETLMSFYGKIKNIQSKQFKGDLVTEADLASETAIIHYLQKKLPDHSILAEESGALQTDSPWQWVIDPLDGTTNFAHHHPLFAVSIGLLYQNKPVVGVVYNPVYQELFQAAEGLGAKLNGNPIHVSQVESLDDSLLASGFPYDRRRTADNNYKEFCHLTHLTQGVRRGGSAALDLAYVAAGRLEGYWERGIKAWDVAAGIVIVQEAGGTTSRYNGDPLEDIHEERILATNGLIHAAISKELAGC